MSPLFWAALLLLAALLLAVLELFLPSGGALGIFAAAAAAAGVFVAYYHGGAVVGTAFLCAVVVAVPVLLSGAVRVWPHTPIGRSVLIPLPESSDEVLPDDDETRRLKALVGRRGVAQSDLLPSGLVRIDRRAYDAVSQGMVIDRGQPVEVVGVRMNCLVVRAADAVETAAMESDDPLARPLESFGLDSIEDPFA